MLSLQIKKLLLGGVVAGSMAVCSATTVIAPTGCGPLGGDSCSTTDGGGSFGLATAGSSSAGNGAVSVQRSRPYLNYADCASARYNQNGF